jgi:hypothetical protein
MLILPSVLVSASSTEFTTDLVPVLSMTKLADASTAVSGVSLSTLSTVFISVADGVNLEGGAEGGGGICSADVLVSGRCVLSTVLPTFWGRL